jgi:hypothetical protein
MGVPVDLQCLNPRSQIRISPLFLCLLGIFSCLAACAPKVVSGSDLSSSLRSLHSQAAEAELIIEYVQAGKSTKQYAHAHARYLADQVKETSERVGGPAESGLGISLAACNQQYRELADQLERLSSALDDPAALADIKNSIQQIREASDKIKLGP